MTIKEASELLNRLLNSFDIKNSYELFQVKNGIATIEELGLASYELEINEVGQVWVKRIEDRKQTFYYESLDKFIKPFITRIMQVVEYREISEFAEFRYIYFEYKEWENLESMVDDYEDLLIAFRQAF